MREKFQQFGKAMLVSLSLIAIGGLLLGLGGAMTSELTVSSLGFEWVTYRASIFYSIFAIIKSLGQVIFSNLSILYAVGVAFSLSQKEQGWAGFSAVVAYLTMQITINTLLNINGLTATTTTIDAFVGQGFSRIEAAKLSSLYTTELGYFTYRTGIFGGILIGIIVSIIHRRFYNIKLPLAMAFFAGTRSVPVLSLFGGALVGGFFYVAWPAIGNALGDLAAMIYSSGLFGTFVYSYVVESLIPFGLHPLLSVPMRWTELGGSMVIDGQLVVGNSAIQLAQLASPNTDKLLVRAFMGHAWIINAAIYPGIALAMYHTAKPESKKAVAAILIPAIVATVFFGITEPMLFTFLFVAPWLYFVIHAPMVGVAGVLAEFFQVSVFQGNIKDLLPFLLRPEKLYLVPYLFLLPAFFVASYFLYRFFILKFNLMTPGRDDENEIRLNTKQEYEEFLKDVKKGDTLAHRIIAGLGGKDNIIELDNCISRLRVIVKNPNLVVVDSIWKKELQASGTIRKDKGIQIIYGPKVAEISVDTRGLLGY